MQTPGYEMPWFRALRAAALMLTVVVSLEWTGPLGGFAQPNQGPAPMPGVSQETQEALPMQEPAVIEEPTPFYKKWWFWTIVAVVAVVVVVAIAASNSEGCIGPCGPPTIPAQ